MNTKLKTAAPALLAAATLFLTACGSDETPAQATPSATTAAATSAASSESSMGGSSMTESSVTESSTSEPSMTESSEEPTSSGPSEETTSSEPSMTESSSAESSETESSAQASAGSGKQVVIKAGAGNSFPAKVGAWVKAPGSGPGSIYDQGEDTVIISFLSGSDYAGISTAVKTEKTPVSSGLCGGTGVEDSYTCYLKTADGVINVSGDALKPVVDFSEELTKTLGAS